jgi:hypothetical protein
VACEQVLSAQEVAVRLMTISEFSARTRLSAKALRLYDRLGLIAPLEVDSSNGYRYYGEPQVADAVLVGLLRRVGMPAGPPLLPECRPGSRPPTTRRTCA